ncbi:MAG TPA: aminoglycoside 3'-phosphotransferase [Acidimicrobiales bacterium]|nr:aminoglycoside 3'-phosphotransferase [Acidimicrobiales bacterium]
MTVTVGMSGAAVERWGARILKSAPPTWDRGLDAEADRLRWLATTPLAPHAPEVVAFEAGPPADRLLTAALPGVDLTELDLDDHPTAAATASRFGRLLRAFHDGLDPAGCPFEARLDVRLAAAERRVSEAGVDAGEFEPEHAGRTPGAILDELLHARPIDEDLVVTHGDWCFPNVVVDDAEGSWGVCDLAGLGVGCRWYDLGIGARSTAHNVGAAHVPAFFEGYGIEPEPERLRYYVLLDELQ